MRNRIKSILREELLKESKFSGTELISVDIQPEYEDLINWLDNYVNWLNRNHRKFNSLWFLYNGADTVGEIDKEGLINWWLDHGLSDDIIHQANWIDKGYGWFRFCIDEDLEEEAIVDFVRWLWKNDIHDSRDLEREEWERFQRETGRDEIRELVEEADDVINIPELMDEIKNVQNPILTGGAAGECLTEVDIAFRAMNRSPYVLKSFTY